MPKLMSSMALFAFAGALFAESPFVGTWSLDSAKTKYSAGTPPTNVKVVIEEQGDKLQITATRTNTDGPPVIMKYSVPAMKDGAGQMETDGPFDAVNSKHTSDNVGDLTFLKNGKEVFSRRTVLAKDGKSMRSTVKGIDARGSTVKGTEVYEKQ